MPSLDDRLFAQVLPCIPRLLGQLCRSRAMRTFGCFDRDYWNHATCDTPNARKQEAALTLALLYRLDRPDNPCAGNPALLQWIEAALDFWARMQLSSGAFNDLYVNEHSYVATAFSTYAVAAAAKTLLPELPVRDHFARAVSKACAWLSAEPPSPVTNQVCGAAAALAQAGDLLAEPRWTAEAGKLTAIAASRQSPEGWLPEYGGPDFGYLSVAVDYLGKVFLLTGDRTALGVASRACRFLASLAAPIHGFGGEFGSRSTAYLLPDGPAVFSGHDQDAAALLGLFARSLDEGHSVPLASLDDKYMLFNGYTYLQAMTRPKRIVSPAEPQLPVHYPECGMALVGTRDIRAVANLRKGGAARILFHRTGRTLHDPGILLAGGDKMLTSSLLGASSGQPSGANALSCSGHLGEPFDNRMSVFKHIALAGAATATGWSGPLRRGVKKLLRELIISRKNRSMHEFCRSIAVTDAGLAIEDAFRAPWPGTLTVSAGLESVYGESSRYMSLDELDHPARTSEIPAPGEYVCTRTYDLRGELAGMTVELRAGRKNA